MSQHIDRDRRRLLTGTVKLALALPLAGAAASLWSGCGGEGSEGPPAGAGEAGGAQPPAPPPAQDAGGAAAPEPAAPAPAEDALVTEIPAMQPMVQSLGYVHASPKPDQHCSNCQFYTATEGGLGRCQLFQQGLVKEGGWCQSWVAKVS